MHRRLKCEVIFARALKVIPTKGFNEEQKRKLKHALEKIPPGVTAKVKVVKEIEKEKSRKYKIILSYVER